MDVNDSTYVFLNSSDDYYNFTEEEYQGNHTWRNFSYFNVTTQYPIDYAEPLFGYVAPILLVVTIVTNGMVIIVFSRPHMRTTTNLVLLAIAISNTLTLVIPAPWLIYMYTFGNHYKPFYPITACYAWSAMIEILPNIFHTSSIWLTVLLALQRYICVKYPLKAKSWVTWSRIVKAIICIGIVAAVHQFSRFFDRIYLTVEIVWEGKPCNVCREEFPFWLTHIFTPNVYFSIYFGFRVLFVHLIPCILLIYLTWSLTVSVYEAQRVSTLFLFRDRPDVNQNDFQHNFNSTTVMLVLDVSIFLLVEAPLTVLTILHIISNTIYEFLDYDAVNISILFLNMFISFSFPINFIIYYGMSQKFRDTFKNLFL